VSGGRQARGLSSERTLSVDVSTRKAIEGHLRSAAEAVAKRLRKHALVARGVRVKLKRSDFRILSRQCTLDEPTDVAAQLFATAITLLDGIEQEGPFRLVGLGGYDLTQRRDDAQLALGLEAAPTVRARRLETALDRVTERFGAGAVQRASDLVADRGVGIAANLDFLDDEPPEQR
jgi:DNA polymerase-4